MMKLIAFTLIVFVATLSVAETEYEVVYETKNSKVIFTKSGQMSEGELNKYGKLVCSNNQFCVLWFYSDRVNADVGARIMKKGDMFAKTTGMYGIFSKNNITNRIICYEPSSGC